MSDQNHPCCAHCGPPTPSAELGTEHGSGLGHSKPCARCAAETTWLCPVCGNTADECPHDETAGTELPIDTLRQSLADARATEAVLRGEIRRSESALKTFEGVVADRDEWRASTDRVSEQYLAVRRERDRLEDAMRGLADSWDDALRAEFGVGSHYTSKFARELRALFGDSVADVPTPPEQSTD